MTTEITDFHLMHHFSAMHFRFVCESTEYIKLDAQPGTAIRGALYHALIELFSPYDPIPGVPQDPVRALLAMEDESSHRGRDVPRAFSVQPPKAYLEIPSGKTFHFGVSLYGSADTLMPYLFRAVPVMGEKGIGKGRGRFTLKRIEEVTPLSDASHVIMHQRQVYSPRLRLTHYGVLETAAQHRADEVTLHFISPMRLIEGGKLVRAPKLGVLLRRLIERAQLLTEHYSPIPNVTRTRAEWREEWERIGALGDRIDADGLLMDQTHWVDIQSYSRARQRSTPIGGFIGKTRWRIDSRPVLMWLLWGQSLHVGKNAAKGDGYFRMI